MLLQMNKSRKSKNRKTGNFLPSIFRKKNRKGLSEVIGYILLISISIIMSVVVFQWLRTYVPKDSPKCAEGTSLFIKEILYDCTNSKLNVSVRNNGKFSINGYFIHVSNKANETLATIDISSNITFGGNISGNSVVFSQLAENSLAPAGIKTCSFNVANLGTLYRLEIIPIRIQEVDGRKRVVSCGDSKVEETLACN